jgi:hypothetical protein
LSVCLRSCLSFCHWFLHSQSNSALLAPVRQPRTVPWARLMPYFQPDLCGPFNPVFFIKGCEGSGR